MKYPTILFETVFKSVVRGTGRPASVIPLLESDEVAEFCEMINAALAEFWIRPQMGFWPGTGRVEERPFEADGESILKAKAGFDCIGFVDLREVLFKNRPEPDDLFEVLGQVEDHGDRLVCLDPQRPATSVWVVYQIPPPKFTRTPLELDHLYLVGELAYDPDTGGCYRATAAGMGHGIEESDYWELVPFPAWAATYVKWAASGEAMAEEEGKYRQLARANQELELQESRYFLPRTVAI